MGQLTNLYVSQSYQGLIKLTDSTTGVTGTLQYLQDGLGDRLPIQMSTSSVAITGSLYGTASYATQALSASWAPDNTDTSSFVTTSSFNAFTASIDGRVDALEIETGSLQNQINGLATTSSLTSLSSSIATTDLNQNNTIAGLATTSSLTSLSSSIASTDLAQNNTIAGLATTSSVNSLSQSIATTDLNQNNRLTSIEQKTGSYATTGSNIFNGNQTISGSLNVTGSITALSASITYLQVVYETSSVIFSSGSNILGDASNDTQTLYGTVRLPNGPLSVTGSVVATNFTGSLQGTASYATTALSSSYSNFALSSSYSSNSTSASFAQNALSASYAPNNGVTRIIAGSNIVVSPTGGVGDVTVTSTGGANYNTATGSYGSFFDTGSYSITNTAAVYSASLSTTAISNGVFLSGSDVNKVYFQNAGVYNVQFSAQFQNSSNTAGNVNLWMAQGNDGGAYVSIPDSNGDVTVPGSHGQISGSIIAGWNLYVTANANDYVELLYKGDSTSLTLNTVAANGAIPRTPSLILTANRIDSFLSNTGSFTGSFIGSFTGNTIGTSSYASNSNLLDGKDSTEFAITGSNNFVGTEVISGSLYVSGSSQKDVIVEGQLWVSSSNTAASSSTVQPQIWVAGGMAGTAGGSRSGSVQITPASVTLTRGVRSVNLSSAVINIADTSINQSAAIYPQGFDNGTLDGKEIGFTISGSVLGVQNFNGPSIWIADNNGAYQGMFGFQDMSNYTNGTITVLTPLSASAGITGSLYGSSSYATQALSASYAPPTPLSGTSNVVPKYDALGAGLTNSNISDNGTNVLIATDLTISSSNPVGTFVNMQSAAGIGFNFDAAYTQFQTTGQISFNNAIGGVGSSDMNFNTYNGGDLRFSGNGSGSIDINTTNLTITDGGGGYIPMNIPAPYGFFSNVVDSTAGPFAGHTIEDTSNSNNNIGLVGTQNSYRSNKYGLVLYGGGTGSIEDSTSSNIMYAYDGNQVDFVKNVTVTGSLKATQGITGSLQGTASFATSASYALSASYAPSNINTGSFATTGSNQFKATQGITGSLNIYRDANALVNFGNTDILFQYNSNDLNSPKVKVGNDNGSSKYPGFGVYVDSSINPGDVYAYFSLDDASNSNNNAGFSNQTFTPYGSGMVMQVYGGGVNSATSDNTIFYAENGNMHITRNVVDVTGSLVVSGSTKITGSVQGNVNALSIASNTASLNLNNGNFFTLQLVSGSATHINPSNIKPGQTVNIRLNTTGSATVTFPSSVKQVSGSAYVPTTTTGVDVITLVSFDTSSLYLANVKNLI